MRGGPCLLMGAKADLRRQLVVAQQQRDRALRERDAARAKIAALEAKLDPTNPLNGRRPTATGRVRGWLDELGKALGVGQ